MFSISRYFNFAFIKPSSSVPQVATVPIPSQLFEGYIQTIMQSGRRVVVTGVGLVSPLGCGSTLVWQRLCAGKSGVTHECFSFHDFPVAMVPRGTGEGDLNPAHLTSLNNMADTPEFIQFALLASELAIQNAGGLNSIDPHRAGVCMASGIGSIQEIVNAQEAFKVSHRKISPYFVPRILINMAAAEVSLKFGLKGPQHACSTACAAGAQSIADAFHLITLNYADVMLAGGTEASINELSLAGFHRLKALSTSTSASKASRPFDANRKGFVMGEGAGVLVLEELSSALRRGASILAEVRGVGLSSDAHHRTAPHPQGEGAVRCMENLLQRAGLRPGDISYINAHATSTPLGDEIEVHAIESVFKDDAYTDLHVSSTKGATGHLLGAAGAIEAAFTAYAVHTDTLPPTLNLEDPLPARFHYVANEAIRGKVVEHAISNSFGFGGVNCSLAFSKYRP